MYSSVDSPPVIQDDVRDTCPELSGPRAFLLATLEARSHGHLHYGAEMASGRPELRGMLYTKTVVYLSWFFRGGS